MRKLLILVLFITIISCKMNQSNITVPVNITAIFNRVYINFNFWGIVSNIFFNPKTNKVENKVEVSGNPRYLLPFNSISFFFDSDNTITKGLYTIISLNKKSGISIGIQFTTIKKNASGNQVNIVYGLDITGNNPSKLTLNGINSNHIKGNFMWCTCSEESKRRS